LRSLNNDARVAVMRFEGGLAMKADNKAKLARRDVLRVLGVSAGAAVTPSVFVTEAQADSESDSDKRKARYDPNSDEIKTYYRVNRYPT
jgi:hypothetical protein